MPTPPPSAGNVWNKGPPGTSTGGSGSTAASNGTGLPQDLLQFSTQPNRVESLFNGHSGMHFPSLFSSDPICSKINMDHSRDTFEIYNLSQPQSHCLNVDFSFWADNFSISCPCIPVICCYNVCTCYNPSAR